MLCEFARLIYPTNTQGIGLDSYMVVAYRPCDKIYDLSGKPVYEIKAVGYGLPISGGLRYDIHGQWAKDSKHGLQFDVESYDEVITPTKEGIIAYLSSGQIKGIGEKTAERIYQAFGDKTLEILDKNPEKLLTIRGISDYKLQKILDSYLQNRDARDIITFLAPHGITANRAVKLYQKYKNQTMEIVTEHPYQLSEMEGIGFLTADKIALSMGFDRMSIDRVQAGILYALQTAESCGHLCLNEKDFLNQCMKLLDTEGLTEYMIANCAMGMIKDMRLLTYKGSVYRTQTHMEELYVAYRVVKKLKEPQRFFYADLDERLDELEQDMRVTLAVEQRNAVKTALMNGISIITGGPGTGKTMIQRAMLKIYRDSNSGNIVCCAPTGRAARRMSQSTGLPASTIHRALGLCADENGEYGDSKPLLADLVVVDEVSMMDIYLSGRLFDSLQKGTQIVMIGDADQLPSVGPGAVLSELIASGCVPVVRLEKVFRQSAGSRIAINAQLIRSGNLNLDYGSDFVFIDSADLSVSAEIIADVYKQEVDKYGVDNVALLTPFRQKTETGANALNERLRDVVNPPARDKLEAVYGKRTFRVGDKVMQIKNREDVNNGDIGYVREVMYLDEEDATMFVDFGDGRIKQYDKTDSDDLCLGYASTIHKSQGSEYNSVIINLQCAHLIMLNRSLIYTAITRSKNRVIIVGERKALCIAIKRTDTEKRGTHLGERIQEHYKEKIGE